MRSALGSRDRALLGRASAVIGIDEVGRGPLAGPVVIGGVAWSTIPEKPEVADSKVMTPSGRERADRWIRRTCDDWVVIEVWPGLIDELNILEATRLAMRTAAAVLARSGAAVIVDGVALPGVAETVIAENRADARFFCVAAASIVAKVHRDRLMTALAAAHPAWSWERNKGYGTKEHRQALDLIGRSFLHRASFSWRPVTPGSSGSLGTPDGSG